MIKATQNKFITYPELEADILRAHHLNMTYENFVLRREELLRQIEILRRDHAAWNIIDEDGTKYPGTG